MCDCVQVIDRELEVHGLELVTTVETPPRVLVKTQARRRRKPGKRTILAATFCPFCGERYPAPAEHETAAAEEG
ncbi:hypothetical protein H0Z60_10040 [Ectothiorhodospiraceae bacterium WFHF3C12]|nr:hypothetical protein [Ectothiorhodospiraceae bacterium WFHF3C12]